MLCAEIYSHQLDTLRDNINSTITASNQGLSSQIQNLELELKEIKEQMKLWRPPLAKELSDLTNRKEQIEYVRTQLENIKGNLNREKDNESSLIAENVKNFPGNENKSVRIEKNKPHQEKISGIVKELAKISEAEKSLTAETAFVEKRLKLLKDESYGHSVDLDASK